jgi:outer membrane receptor protein involved in Fe transport
VLSNNLFLEAQYSEKEYTFLGGGSRWVDDPALGQYDGTLLRDRTRGLRRFWSPTFRLQDGGEQRDHELYTIKGSYFLSSQKLGSHELKAGYEYFDEVRNVNNYQNGSDYRVYPYATIIRGNEIYPRFRTSGTSTRIYWLPIFVESQGSHYASDSFYVNDRWILNDRWTFNLGLRYDQNDAVSGDGEFQIDDSDAWSPRFAANFDVRGDGRLKVTASYGQYIGRLAEGVGNDGDPAGRNASFSWSYKASSGSSPTAARTCARSARRHRSPASPVSWTPTDSPPPTSRSGPWASAAPSAPAASTAPTWCAATGTTSTPASPPWKQGRWSSRDASTT